MTSTDKHASFIPVSFFRTPAYEISDKIRELEAQGWIWVRNMETQWVALMRKDHQQPVSERSAEEEIRTIMGENYVNLAAPGSPRDVLGPHASLIGSVTAIDVQTELLKSHMRRGWTPTALGRAILTGCPPATDSEAEVEEGGGQIAVAPRG